MKSKSRNKVIIIISSVILILSVSIFAVYYYLGIGFGNAVINTVKGVKEAKEEWKKDNVNPIDTIKSQVIEIAQDSTSNSGK